MTFYKIAITLYLEFIKFNLQNLSTKTNLYRHKLNFFSVVLIFKKYKNIIFFI